MAISLEAIIELAVAFAFVIFISGWLKQDQDHDGGPMKPVRVPVTVRKFRRRRR